jgi:hypothetical protein
MSLFFYIYIHPEAVPALRNTVGFSNGFINPENGRR